MNLTSHEHLAIARAIADDAVADLHDVETLTITETADPRDLGDDDVEAIAHHVSEIATSLEEFLGELAAP